MTTGQPKPTDDASAKAMLQVIDEELERFSEVFSQRANGDRLARYEREILRSYLWWRLVK